MIELFNPNIDRYIYAILIFIFFQFFRLGLKQIVYKLASKTTSKLDDDILDAVKRPVDFLFIIIGANFAKTVLILDDGLNGVLDQLIRSGFIIVIFWAIINLLGHLSTNIQQITNKFGDKINPDVANFLIKSIRFFIFLIGFIAVLQEWGYNISGFLASLGLVGMAFALAAKDTASNLFGSLVIFTDKPFRIGDWIKTPEVEGTIESVGIRSTRVRTFAQALVTVPNGILANSAILNWSKMGKRRIKMDVGLTYDTSPETIANIIKDIKNMLENHKDINQDGMHIYFSKFDASSLNIFCYYFTNTTVWGDFMSVREDTYFKIMKIVEKNGSSFAFPTQTLHIEQNTASLENNNIVE
ncbi:MAG: mechanosensitive ion channel family protein [Epsilonproteobacteria bacterium]|nr:MAG: mechanosensitive ion channel family protein [Campylobacterota bacterium]